MPSTKSNGDPLEGTIAPSMFYHPNPAAQDVNAHPLDYAYQLVSSELPGVPQNVVAVNGDWYYPDYDPVTNTNGVEKVRIYLQWDDAPNAVRYELYANGAFVASFDTAQGTVSDLPIDTDYTFNVEAFDGYSRGSGLSDDYTVNTSD